MFLWFQNAVAFVYKKKSLDKFATEMIDSRKHAYLLLLKTASLQVIHRKIGQTRYVKVFLYTVNCFLIA